MNLTRFVKCLILLFKAERLVSAVKKLLLVMLLLMPVCACAAALVQKPGAKRALKAQWRKLMK